MKDAWWQIVITCAGNEMPLKMTATNKKDCAVGSEDDGDEDERNIEKNQRN